jgi:hypothetical protein
MYDIDLNHPAGTITDFVRPDMDDIVVSDP